jgi:hypothetical protein
MRMKQKRYQWDEAHHPSLSHTLPSSLLWVDDSMDWYVFILDLVCEGSQQLQLRATVPRRARVVKMKNTGFIGSAFILR